MFCNKKCDGEYDGIIHQFALSSLAVRTHHLTTQHNIDWVFQIVSGLGDGKKKRTQTDVNIARGALTKEPATAQKATAQDPDAKTRQENPFKRHKQDKSFS